MKYSIIIPVYNAEKTLYRCLDSLLPQLNEKIEVILVNDGSSDSSGEICREYLKKSKCFKLFEQENSGASFSRNKGLDNAKGEYILFVDSDDYVDADYIETIENYIEAENPDLLIFSVSFLNSNRKDPTMRYEDMRCFGDRIAEQRAYLGKQRKLHTLWNKVFKNKIITENNIRFYNDLKTGEDSIFVFHYLFFINSLITKSDILYYVDEDSTESLSRKRRYDLPDQLILASVCTEDTLSKVPLTKQQLKKYKKGLSFGYYRGAYSCFNDVSIWIKDKNEKKNEFKRICLKYKNNRKKPEGIKATLMALPVLLKITPIIRLILFAKNRR